MPKRWEWHGGKIYYQIPPSLAGHAAFGGRKRRIPLGKTLTEAHRTWADLHAQFDTPLSSEKFPDVALSYTTQELPVLAQKTQSDYRSAIARLTGAFQEFTIHQIEPSHCYAYVDANLHRVRQARYDIRVLSAILSWCVMKGWMKANPLIRQVKFTKKRFNPKVRRHYIPDDDLKTFMGVIERKWQLYVLLKLKTGQTQQTLLTTTRHHLLDEGIDFNRSKTDVDILFDWDDELRAIVDEIRHLRRKVDSIYLFANRWGGCYYNPEKGASGFQSMWQRWQKKALAAGMKTKFCEHQLLHKTVSDNVLSHASAARGHADERITRDVYQVKKPRLKPLGISSTRKQEKQ